MKPIPAEALDLVVEGDFNGTLREFFKELAVKERRDEQ